MKHYFHLLFGLLVSASSFASADSLDAAIAAGATPQVNEYGVLAASIMRYGHLPP